MNVPERFKNRVLLSATEVASLTPFQPRLIASLIERGVLKGRKECGSWVVDAESAREWLGCVRSRPKALHPLAAELLKRVGS